MSNSPTPRFETREEWLNAAAEELAVILGEHGYKKLPKMRFSCGWPATGGTRAKNRRIGECWHADASKDQVREIFITPLLDTPVAPAGREYDGILHVQLHEMLHAVLPAGTGHKAPFARLAKAVGLEGKPTSTHAGEALNKRLEVIASLLGTYPHGALDLGGRIKQTTRLLKVFCPECGYTCRITQKWIELGLPECPVCNQPMTDDPDALVEQPLKSVERHMFFETPDKRFRVKYSRQGETSQGRWTLTDFESGRMVPVDDRQDAMDTIEAIRIGLLTLDPIEGIMWVTPFGPVPPLWTPNAGDEADYSDWPEDDDYIDEEDHEEGDGFANNEEPDFNDLTLSHETDLYPKPEWEID
jgi:hypothetical protein